MTEARSPPPPPALAQRLRAALALHQQGRLAEAEAAYHAVLRDAPGQFDALHLAGVAAYQTGRFHEAEPLIAQALAARPDNPEALNNFGNVLKALGRLDAALASYAAALAVRPDYAEAWHNRGNALRLLRRHAEAVACYDRALSLRPPNADTLVNRGNALLALGRTAEAVACYDRTLALRPNDVDALNNRGHALTALRRYPAAAAAFGMLARHHPDHPYAAAEQFLARLRCCDWDDYAASAARLADAVAAGGAGGNPFAFLVHCGDPALQLRCAAAYAAREFPPDAKPVWRGERYRHARIRVAYLSADFHEHATASLMAGLFEAHDRGRFELTAVSFGPDAQDGMRARLRGAFDRFLDVRDNTDREVALLLREREIDIAVDLKGFTNGCRTGIFAQRGAPLQVGYLGYPGSMGAGYIDYLIADRCVVPAEAERHYSEKIVCLPDSYQVNDTGREIEQRSPARAEMGLPQAGFVFCCFNNSYKIAPAVFDVWMRLLRGVEGSVLWLLDDNADATRNLRREAARRGVAAERLVFAPRLPPAAHLARHRLADLFLDTLPVNAHTTASDALWAGLPLLTCTGESFSGRVAASLLHAVGLPELVTRLLPEYEALALRLARDRNALVAIRARLVGNRKLCPLFDTDRFRRRIEAAFVSMWERAERGEAPTAFAAAGEVG